MASSDFDDYRAKVNEYVEAHKSQPAINKLLHNEPISVDDYKELERIFTEELSTAEDYQMNYQDIGTFHLACLLEKLPRWRVFYLYCRGKTKY